MSEHSSSDRKFCYTVEAFIKFTSQLILRRAASLDDSSSATIAPFASARVYR
eukprot:SAG31_NODE_3984_length_3686_cov_2.132980_3_plen_52_part_00